MYRLNHKSNHDENRSEILHLIGKTFAFAFIALLFLTAANTNLFAQSADGFNPNVSGSSVSYIKTIVRQPDGKILIGGDFYTVGGQPRLNLARVNVDGTLDTTFTSPFVTGDSIVYAITLQPDGKILVAASFQNGGQPVIPLVRLNSDGTRDTTFNLPQFNGAIYSMLVQDDGKIIVGGIFTIIGTSPNAVLRRFVARISSDGSSVDSFNPVTPNFNVVQDTRGGGGGGVRHIIRQPDGKIILGGYFLFLNGTTNFGRYNIARVDVEGNFDSFDPGQSNGGYEAVVLQPDGKVLVGGGFSSIGNTQVRGIVRLDANGAIDTSFNAMFTQVTNNCCISAVVLQADGKILVGGSFVQIGGQSRTNLARLKPNGTADSFSVGNNSDAQALLIQPDGKIIVGGAFNMISGQPRNKIARLYSSEIGEGTQPILFVSNRDGNNEIYRMNVDGSNQQRLTNTTESETSPVWSPDGTKILFTRIVSTNVRHVWTMNADGSNPTRLSAETVYEFGYRYSPNGQKILFERRPAVNVANLWTMNVDGTNKVQLTNSTLIDHFAEWSPDGSKVAFGRCTPEFICDIHTVNTDGSGLLNLTPDNPNNDDDNPKWTRDGSRIVYGRFSGDRAEPYIMNANGGSSKMSLGNFSAGQYGYPQAISPDGNMVALDLNDNATITSREIYKVGINGGVPVNLTNNNVYDTFRAWSPDSTKIAFQSRRDTTTDEIYTMNADGTNVVRLTFNTATDSVTDWFKPAAVKRAPFDFDGDGKSDVGIYRANVGQWWINRSANNLVVAAQFGESTDKITPADFTGDGKADLAFFRPSNGFWYILRSEDNSFYGFPFGTNGDVPIAADFDGDGKADQAVFRAANSGWYIQKSSGGIDSVTFGISSDKPVVADFDGDGKADIAITRINNGNREWWGRKSSNGQIFAVTFGDQSDKPVIGDYTGDGKADIAFWRPSNGFWYILRSEDNSFYGFPFGTSGDQPTPGDFDGDGKFDASVYRQSNNGWYQLRSTQGFTAITFGASGDVPVQTAFLP